MAKLYVNTDDRNDIVTLGQIRQRYIDINGTDEEFDEYAKNGFSSPIPIWIIIIYAITPFKITGSILSRRSVLIVTFCDLLYHKV